MSKNIETFISRYQYELIALTFGITLVIAFLVGVLFYRQGIVLDNQKAMLQNDAGAKKERSEIMRANSRATLNARNLNNAIK